MTDFPTDPATAAAWLADRRWYGDKSRPIARLAQQDLATVRAGEVDVTLKTLAIRFADGGEAIYFVPLLATDSPVPVESLSNEAFQTWLAEGFADNRHLTINAETKLVWQSSTANQGRWWDLVPDNLKGEQSNTSIRFGDDAVMKVFRKWQPGINPDTEIVEFLTEKAHFPHVPAFLGSIRLFQHGVSTEVAAVQNFVANQGDAWMWLPSALASPDPASESDLLGSIRLLGQRTGELHVALASGLGDAFAPEVISPADAAEIRRRIERELAMTIEKLRASGYLSEPDATALEWNLLDRIGEITSQVGTRRTRVHGDYHLGQVLRSHGDFVIIDFEGEPSRTMDERRQKHSPLKDVAGMLRSLDYAVATAVANQPYEADRLRELGPRKDEAFLAGYREAVCNATQPLVPNDDQHFMATLRPYMIEKALYEMRYEMDNRPDWVDIPLNALHRIATEGVGEECTDSVIK